MDSKLKSYISTRDKRLAKDYPWLPSISSVFDELMDRGSVVVGGRSTCGSGKDPTWAVWCAWREVVSKALKLGYDIREEPIKHGNGWATKSGGFWEESRFTMGADRTTEDSSSVGGR